MKLATVRKLELGDEVIYGDKIVRIHEYNPVTASMGVDYPVNARKGIVLKVTNKGGVRVEINGGIGKQAKRIGEEEWTAFFQILQRTGRVFTRDDSKRKWKRASWGVEQWRADAYWEGE